MSDTSLKHSFDTELAETSRQLLASGKNSELLRHLCDNLSLHLGAVAVAAAAFTDSGRSEKNETKWPEPLHGAVDFNLIHPDTEAWSGPVKSAPEWLRGDFDYEQYDLSYIESRRIAYEDESLGYVIVGFRNEAEQSNRAVADLLLTQAGFALNAIKLKNRMLDNSDLQESLISGLIVVSRDGAVISANHVVEEMLGRQVKPGKKLTEYLDELAAGGIQFDVSKERIVSTVTTGRQLTAYGEIGGDVGLHLQMVIAPLGKDTSDRASSLITIRDVTQLIEKTLEANDAAQRAQRHARELAEIADMAELTSVFGFDLDEVYQKFLTKLLRLMQSPKGAIYLYQPASQKLHLKTGLPIIDWPKEVELSSRLSVAKAFIKKRPVDSGGENNELAMPVAVNSKVLGVVSISGRNSSYTDHDKRLVGMVTARLAILIENARLYHDVNARRERWEAVFQFTEEGIVIFDRKGLIVGFNPASTRLTKFSQREAVGQHFNRVVRIVTTDGQSLEHMTPINQVLNEAKTLTKIEQLIETKGGDRLWVESSYSPIFNNAGQVTSGIAIMRNIQKDREVEEIKSDFISIVSHELRTPLSAIKGFLDMILKKDFGALNDKQFHYLTRVYQSNQRMIDLVEDLLDVSYIESGKINLNQNPLAPEGVITDVVTELAAKGFEKQITLRVNRKQRLPLVLADETRLRQILVNLVDNAIKYSFPKSEVLIDFKVQGDELVTSVTDNGVGVSPGQVDRIFQKFGRIYNPMSIQAGGTGLGLYIVKRLVESHGGRIWVSTKGEGKGSKFSFSLPIAKQLPLI